MAPPAPPLGPLPPHLTAAASPAAPPPTDASPESDDQVDRTEDAKHTTGRRTTPWLRLLGPLLFAFTLVAAGSLVLWRVALDRERERAIQNANAAENDVKPAVVNNAEREISATQIVPTPDGATGSPEGTSAPGQRYEEVDVWVERVRSVTSLNALTETAAATKVAQSAIVIDIRIRNGGEDEISYDSWQSRGAARLSSGRRRWPLLEVRPYRKVELHSTDLSTVLDAGSVVRDSLIFKTSAVAARQDLLLELPAVNLGGRGVFRFRLPADRMLVDTND